MAKIYVINSRGEREIFSQKKVYDSVRKSGAPIGISKEISKIVKKEVFPGIKTSQISEKIKSLLSKKFPKASFKFSLKEAMRKLGPSGFPFEKYVGEIFLRNGFKVRLNQELGGFCLPSYEIDFLAEKDGITYIGECKYRQFPGQNVDLRTALANQAKFLDIKKFFKKEKLKSILVTNAKFTREAILYSECQGVKLLGWKYPKNRGLEYLIEERRLYPITILPSFKTYLKEIFSERKLMLVEDILNDSPEKLARELKISQKLLEALIEEAKILME